MSQGLTLRPYQVAMVGAVQREFAAGKQAVLVVMATGTGKTVCFAELARLEVAAAGRVLVLAHREELLDQAARKLEAAGVRASVDQASRVASTLAKVVVASVQTLQRKRLTRYKPEHFTLIIVDEAHHAAAKSYGNILEYFTFARRVGVTATGDRADGKALGKIFDSVAFTYEIRTAIDQGHLVKIRARRVMVRDVDLSQVRSHHGDFDAAELGAAMAQEKALHGVVDPLVRLAADRKTMVFAVDVAHAKGLAAMINRYKPGSALALDGSASKAERDAGKALFADGRIQFLVNCQLFTEGFDEPSIECVAAARPTQSRALYTQQLGRGTRPSPDTGKVDLLVLDFVGNSKHRLIGPADVLVGGDVGEHAREVIDAAMATEREVELDDLVTQAEEHEVAKRIETSGLALAMYRTKEIDPFLGDFMPKLDPNSPAAKMPATEKQLAALKAAGMGTPPEGFTMGAASAMLDAIAERRRAGLASVPQCRALERIGINTKGMTFTRANALIAKAKPSNWQSYSVAGEPEFTGRRR